MRQGQTDRKQLRNGNNSLLWIFPNPKEDGVVIEVDKNLPDKFNQ
jgi:hypothetical protein